MSEDKHQYMTVDDIQRVKKEFLKEGGFGRNDICLIEDFVVNLIGSIKK